MVSDIKLPIKKYISYLERVASREWTLVASLVSTERLTSPKLIGIRLLGASEMWLTGVVPGFYCRVQYVCQWGSEHGHRQACMSLGVSPGTGAGVGW